MSFRQWCERFIAQPAQAMPVAIALALLPGPHWFGIVLATLVLLRSGGLLSYLGYVAVLAAAYASEQHYSFTGASYTIGPFLSLFVPIGLMGVVLRMTRQLGLALEVGAFIMAGIIVFNYLVAGPYDIDKMVAFFEHRRELMGYTEIDALSSLYNISLEQAAFMIMLFWPFLYFTFQSMILLLSRYFQAALYYKGGFAKDFQAIRLSKVAAVFFGVAFLADFFSPNSMEVLSQSPEYVIISQLSAVALGLLVLAGLGMVHWYVAFKRKGWWVLLLLYASIMLLGPVILPGLVLLALVDAGLDLRRRMLANFKSK